MVAELARLDGAARRVVFGIEVQHDGPFPHQLAQPHRPAGLRREREIGRDVALLDARAQWAIPLPPGSRFALCISSSIGSASTNSVPNKRNSCSNDCICACFCTIPLRIATALDSTRPTGVPLANYPRSRNASRSCV